MYFSIILLFLVAISPSIGWSATTLCYFSLNQDKEFKVMENVVNKLNQVSKEKIEIKEFQTENGDPQKDFEAMINSGTVCNGLVISGHHTGSFGGKRSRGSLDISFLEKLSCMPPYANWFNNIRSLWLQGCRTLGVKIEADEYDNITNSADANTERVGAIRGEDFLEQG